MSVSDADYSPLWGDDRVPSWACDADTHSLTKSTNFKALTGGQVCAAPAWRYAFAATILLWSFFFLCPLLTWATAKCNGKDVAENPPWVLFCYLPFLAGSILLEIKAHSYILPWHVRILHADTPLGKNVSFQVWFILVLSLSIVSHLDLATNGIFLGRLLRTSSCPESLVDRIWERVVSKSWAPFLPNLGTLGLCAWALMPLQLLCGIVNGVPVRKHKEKDYTLSELLVCTEATMENKDRYCGLLSGSRGTVDDAMEGLAEAARMNLLTWRSFSMMKAKRRHRLDIGIARSNWLSGILRLAERAAAYLLFESSIQLKLQSSVFAATLAAGQEPDRVTITSMSLTAIMAIVNLLILCRKMKDMCCEVIEHIDMEDAEYDVKRGKRILYGSVVLLGAAAVVILGVIIYTMNQMYHVLFICKDKVWNLSGCVTIGLV